MAWSLDTSCAQSLDKHGTAHLVYSDQMFKKKKKKTCIGRRAVYQTLGPFCGCNDSLATADGGRGPRSSRVIRMSCRFRQADLHIQARCLVCVWHVHTQVQNIPKVSPSANVRRVRWSVPWPQFGLRWPQLVPITSRSSPARLVLST